MELRQWGQNHSGGTQILTSVGLHRGNTMSIKTQVSGAKSGPTPWRECDFMKVTQEVMRPTPTIPSAFPGVSLAVWGRGQDGHGHELALGWRTSGGFREPSPDPRQNWLERASCRQRKGTFSVCSSPQGP